MKTLEEVNILATQLGLIVESVDRHCPPLANKYPYLLGRADGEGSVELFRSLENVEAELLSRI